MTKTCHSKKLVSKTDSLNSPEQTMTVPTQNPSGIYHLTSLKNTNIKSLNLTLNFIENSNKILGFSGCNRFSGTYTIKKDSIFFGALITTKMFCEKTQETEDLMLRSLSKTNSFLAKQNVLILKNNKDILIEAQKENIETPSEIKKVQDNITIEYKAISKGTYNHIIITHSTILVKKDLTSNEISKACNEADWTKLMNALNTIDLKTISTFKAPTQARLYDGAASAQLTITKENDTFRSNSFDHGKPPQEIEALVNQIIAIYKNIE
jgi:heat shock protein HslJ